MKKHILFLFTLLPFTIFAQGYEQGEKLEGDVGADSSITYKVENTANGMAGFKAKTPTDSTSIYQDTDTSELKSSTPFVVRPPFIIENGLQITSGNPGSGKVLTSDGVGNVTFQSPTVGTGGIIFYSITYAEAEDSVSQATLVKGAYYSITDKNVIIQAVTDTSFSLYGTYIRSGTEFSSCLYDFTNDFVLEETANNSGTVGADKLALDYGLVDTDPRTVYRWSDASVLSNYVKNATFDIGGSSGQVFFNTITNGAVVTISGDGNFANNDISGEVTATLLTGDFGVNTVDGTSTVDISGMSGEVSVGHFLMISDADFTGYTGTSYGITSKGGNITAAGNTNLTHSTVHAGLLDISGTADFSGGTVLSNGSAYLSGNIDASDSQIGGTVIGTGGSIAKAKLFGDTVIISGNADATGLNMTVFSDAFISDNANASDVGMYGGNRLTISGNVDARSVSMYTGAKVVATDDAFIEGTVFRNVSDCLFEDSVILSPGHIENQSTLRLSGTGNYGNAHWHRVEVYGADSVMAVNSHFYNVKLSLDSAADVRNSYFSLAGTGNPVLYYNNEQPNQYVTTQRSTKTERLIMTADTVDFMLDSLFHWVGNFNWQDGVVTINAFKNLVAAPVHFRVYASSASDTIKLNELSASADIILPFGVSEVIASSGQYIDFEHKNGKVYVVRGTSNAIFTGFIGGEMGFGDSLSTQALTQNVWKVVTNGNNDLWASSAVDLNDVTYSNDSLIIGVSGYYSINAQLSVDGSSSSIIRLGVYLNGSLACTCTGYQELFNNRIIQLGYIDIDYLNKGDVLQVVVMNTANDDDLSAVGGKITVVKQ